MAAKKGKISPKIKRIFLHGKRGQGKFASVNDSDYEKINRFKWFLHHSGHAFRNNPTDINKPKTPLMHREISDFPKQDIDHKNHNQLDNTRENLRICTKKQNQGNRRLAKNNKLGLKGVHLARDGRNKPYRASITKNGTNIKLGDYETSKEAAIAYNGAAKEYFGKFAYLN
jgi:hypothetical protein